MRGTIKSFDYFAKNLPNLHCLIWLFPENDEIIDPIPHLKNLSDLEIHGRRGLYLIADNWHIDGHLNLDLRYTHYADAETVHVTHGKSVKALA